MTTGSTIRVAWFGDIVGKAGRAAAVHAASVLRASPNPPHLIVANAENARHGRGLHPEGLEELRAGIGGEGGIDVLTLGDHAMDDPRILGALKDPKSALIAPINMDLPDGVKRRWVADGNLVFLIVLGRIFMRTEFPCPFAALDAAMESIARDHPGAMVLLEVHAEATSEKQALAWHAHQKWGAPGGTGLRPVSTPGGTGLRPVSEYPTVVAIVGSHTHVQTSDARLLDSRTAALTDLGMTGASRSVIGFLIDGSINRLKIPPSGGLDVAEEAPVAHGALIEIDTATARATSISTLRIPLP